MGKKETANFEYVIELEGLTRTYGFGDTEFNALDDINLKIRPGEFVVVMGPSGCGKTTLLNVLGLIDESSDGEYHLEGRDVSNLSSRQKAKIRNQRIGLVFQNFNLIPRLSVIENVALPLLYAGVSRGRRLEKASQILSSFQLSEREYYMPWQISGGQVQRVAIARALINDPAIILADEPTGNLDSKASHIIMEELYRLNQIGNTIVMVTHNPNLTSYADRVITMLDGKIISDKDNNSGEESVADAPQIKLVEEESEPKVTEIIVTPTEADKSVSEEGYNVTVSIDTSAAAPELDLNLDEKIAIDVSDEIVKPEPNPEPESKPESDSKPKSKAETKSKAESRAKVKSEDKTKSKSETKTKTRAKNKKKSTSKSKPKGKKK
ncbi:MAG: ATP-binding cassette domain-containing protein [Candidatus Nanosyncoccaceae bacterium]|jgi:putative ABC transport system ATP-binding protein